MSTHSLFSPSAAHRWIPCPGSMAFPENTQDNDSSTFADDGTASHEWASQALSQGFDAGSLLDDTVELNGKIYTMDEERAGYVQMYLDDVRRRAIGGYLFVEQRVDISEILGEGQGGTTDAAIVLPEKHLLIVEDLKYGRGERVCASYDGEPNYQLALYALGLLKDAAMLGEIYEVTLVICQPRLGHIDEFTLSVADLIEFAGKAKLAVEHASKAMAGTASEMVAYMNPGEKQCRWCRAKAFCPAAAKRIAAEVRADFDTIAADPPAVPQEEGALERAYSILPFIQDWCGAVAQEVHRRVREGSFMGSDGQPMKFVEGKPGKRQWADEKAATAALVAELGGLAYEPQKVITAPAAGKLLDKKATKQLWKETFEPLIKKAPGKPVLALGSDPRPAFAGVADANEFDELGVTE